MDNEHYTHPSNDSQQFTPTPQEHSQKKSRKNLIIIALVIAVVVAGLLVVLNLVDKSGNNSRSATSTQLPVTTYIGDAFIDDRYVTGARALVVEGSNVEVLGLTSDAARLAIIEDGDKGSILAVYDTRSQSRVASTPVSSCTRWHEDEVVCSSDKGSIRAYSMKDATPLSDTVLYRHPFATDRADVSMVNELDYLGEANGAHLLTLEASNSFFGDENMTEEERASAGPSMFGLRTVKKRLVVAIDGAGSTKWSSEVGDGSVCGLVANGSSALCASTQDSGGGSDLLVLDSSDGQPMLRYNTNRDIVVASDGWVEYQNSSLDIEGDVGSVLSDAMNGTKIYIFGLDGKMKQEAQMAIGVVPGAGFIPESAWVRGKRVLYTTEQIASGQTDDKVLGASGDIVAVSGVDDMGQYTVTPTSDEGFTGTGKPLFSSADGHLVVTLGAEDASSMDSWQAYLMDLRTGKKIQSLDKGSSLLMQVNKGLIVAQEEPSFDSFEQRNTIIYLPGK